jgi:uncharacterized coiled-coil DUF342 family protein
MESPTPDPIQQQILSELREIRHQTSDLQNQFTGLQNQFVEFQEQTTKNFADLRTELKAEVERWDQRFFDFARDSLNRANTLIASATISVIVGMILLIFKQS